MTTSTPPTLTATGMTKADAKAAAGADADRLGIVPLTSLLRGQRAVIRETRMPADDAALLRAMGLCDCALLTVARTGEPCVVTVTGVDGAACTCHRSGGCRIGLARAMAERIFVSVLA